MDLHKTVQQALDLWGKLTFKVQKPEGPNGVMIRNFGLYEANKDLKESSELDPSGLLTLLLLDYFVEEYLTLWELPVICLLGPEYVSPYLKQRLSVIKDDLAVAKKLFDLLRSEELNAVRDEFRAGMLVVLASVGIDREDVADVLDEKHAVAFLRRDALKAAAQLTVHQFMQGESDGADPVFYEDVMRFWNVNSMIRSFCAPGAPSGVALCIMWEPEAHHSYFAFGVKNGATFSLMTDKTEDAHPLQKKMSRSRAQGRRFDERASRYHFPYQVLGIEVESSGDMNKSQTHRTGLVMYQERPEPLVKVADLEPEQVIWTVMVFGLIKQKFWVDGFRTKLLSYTGEMVRVPEALGAGRSLMTLTHYKPLELPPITVAEISDSELAMERGGWARKPSGESVWMLERYKDLVQQEDLNRVGPDEIAYLPLPKAVQKSVTEAETRIAEGRHLFDGTPEQIMAPYMLRTLDPTLFGTKETIEKDRYWTARYNLAKRVENAAFAEFNARKQEIIDWYGERVQANAPALLRAVAVGELIAPDIAGRGFDDGEWIQPQNIMGLWRRAKRDERYDVFIFGDENVKVNIGSFYKDRSNANVDLFTPKKDYTTVYITERYACFVTGTGGDAPYQAYFRPQTAAALALIAGCEVADLPDVLQHWLAHESMYRGNSTLQRLDPVDAFIKDPWRGLTFAVRIMLGPSGYNQIRKEAGLPLNRFWEVDKNAQA